MIYCSYIKKPSKIEGFSFEYIKDSLTQAEQNIFDDLSLNRKIEKKIVFDRLSNLLSSVLNKELSNYFVEKDKKGKPFLKSKDQGKSPCFISYSHSRTSALISISEDYDLGVDIESKSRFLNHKAFIKWLHPKENEFLKNKKNNLIDKATIWTRKEALTKLTGLGYNISFKDLNVFPSDQVFFDGIDYFFFSKCISSDEVLSIATASLFKEDDIVFID